MLDPVHGMSGFTAKAMPCNAMRCWRAGVLVCAGILLVDSTRYPHCPVLQIMTHGAVTGHARLAWAGRSSQAKVANTSTLGQETSMQASPPPHCQRAQRTTHGPLEASPNLR